MDPELDDELSAWMLSITIAHTEVDGPIARALARNGFTTLESLDFSETELKEFTGLPIGIVRSFRRKVVEMRTERGFPEMTAGRQDPLLPVVVREASEATASEEQAQVAALPGREARITISLLAGSSSKKSDLGYAGLGSAAEMDAWIADIIHGARQMPRRP